MITLYTWTTPNGRKASIALEEMGLEYEVKPVNIMKGEQFRPDFLAVSPNNKIPTIVDNDAPGCPLSVFESGAILVYLAEKSGKLLPPSGPMRAKVLEWLFWQVGGLGPMLGQLGFFGVHSKEKNHPAIDRYHKESERLLGVMEKRLNESEYLGGPEYSVADIASYPWAANTRLMLGEFLKESVANKPALTRWLDVVVKRPAVMRGMKIPDVSR